MTEGKHEEIVDDAVAEPEPVEIFISGTVHGVGDTSPREDQSDSDE